MKRQITSLILAAATLLSILTVPAGAVSPTDGSASLPDTIKMTDCDANGTSYISAGIGQCNVHQLKFDVDNRNTIGFCAEHGKEQRLYLGHGCLGTGYYLALQRGAVCRPSYRLCGGADECL